ncbi:MAG TPA: MetQ/NlpA family lipoprotein [Chitinophagales bacterium]
MNKIYFFATVVCVALLSACQHSAPNNNPNHIIVGTTTGPEQALAEAAKYEAKHKFNLNVELVSFNDYEQLNEALNNGDIDVNAFQHVPYLKAQEKEHGYKLAIVGNTFVYPIVAYSKKIKTVDELSFGDTIVIPNDPANGGRALLLLQQNDLISLRDGVGFEPKKTDIIENTKDLQIMQIDAAKLPSMLDSSFVALAITNGNYATQAGLDPKKLGVFKEDAESPYVNVIASRTDNQYQEKVKNFVEAYQSDTVYAVAEKIFNGEAVKGW